MKFRRSFALLMFAAPLVGGACTTAETDSEFEASADELRNATDMTKLLARVPAGTAWKDVSPAVKARLERNAALYQSKVRHDWGTKGLDEKEARLVGAATPPMIENFDRVLKHLFAADVPADFVPSTAVTNAPLLLELKRFYLVYCAERRHLLLSTNPDFKDWDGGPVTEFLVRDVTATEEQKNYARAVQARIDAIPAAGLSDIEKRIVTKTRFLTRALAQAANGFSSGGNDTRQMSTAAANLYDFGAFHAQAPGGSKLFTDDNDFLLALNATTFPGPMLYGNVGTADAFVWDQANYVEPEFLKSQGLDLATSQKAKNFVVLANWWKERVLALPEAQKRCTVYSPAENADIWEAFTADNFSNADGKQTMASYAATYQATVTLRNQRMNGVADMAIDSAFPSGLTAQKKAQVKAAIHKSTRPAAIVETIVAALDTATGNTTASVAFKAKLTELTMIGGYAEGEALRPADLQAVNEMYDNVKKYIGVHYAGRTVDIAALLPPSVVVTTSNGIFAGASPTGGATITVGVGTANNKAALYSTLLHESKHAIDFASKASVQGAAWEGAAISAETLVHPKFIAEVMAAEGPKLPFYALSSELANVRTTATTDATLKVYLRKSCGPTDPDSNQFAKSIVEGYGYTDPATLTLRARRAHYGAQYLSYDYGQVIYVDLMTWLQGQLGNAAPAIDPYLLQACGMPSPNKDAAAVAKLKSCLGL